MTDRRVPTTSADALAQMRRAIDDDELVLHYQPVVDLETGHAVGVEALVRWAHPTGGLLAPDDFLPAMASTPVITALTGWVLRTACQAAARWPSWSVAVNITARDLLGDELAACVAEATESAGITPDRLVLELTETTLVQDLDQAAVRLGVLRDAGVALTLDDFGTGYSSMLYLRELPVTGVKIDREFTSGLEVASDNRAIVASLLTLARTIGLTATAEGVETEEQVNILRSLDCPFGQGFWWGRPQPAEAMDEIYRTRLVQQPTGPPPRAAARQGSTSADASLLDRVQRLLAKGASLHTIAAALNAAGERTSTGARWHPASVARLISGHLRTPTADSAVDRD